MGGPALGGWVGLSPRGLKRSRFAPPPLQAAEDHEKAVKDFEQVAQLTETKEAAAELREAKILLKRSKRKDYYKILGVPVRDKLRSVVLQVPLKSEVAHLPSGGGV